MSGDPTASAGPPSLKSLLRELLVPDHVRKDAWSLRHTLYLGEIAFFLVVILFATGALLMLRYTPTPELAHPSVLAVMRRVPFGAMIRGAHVAASYGLLAVMFLHILRVFYTAAFKGGRALGWYAGVGLLILFALQSYTGYLLPWDQTAYWGTIVGTNIAAYAPLLGERIRVLMLGGHDIGAQTLLRFYVAHVALLPAAIVATLCVHFYSLRKAGLTAPARAAGSGARTHSAPEVVFKMTSLFLATLLAVLVAGALFPPSLEVLADPAVTPNPARAPWFVSGLQELVHYSAFWGGVAAPSAGILLMLLLPWIDRSESRLPSDRRGIIALGTIFVSVFLAATAIGNFFRGPAWAWKWPW